MMLAPGTKLGSYEVSSSLGAGGMGEVYRARDTRLQRDVAIKVLPEAFASDPERLSRFEREAHLLASLNHSHIAHIYGLEGQYRQDGQEQQTGPPFIVMEFVDGPTLAERLAHGRIAVDDALPIARQIAEALETAHEQGIIHRDLKPANVKVKDDGTVKVLDFGLAKALGGGSPLSPRSVAPGAPAGLSMSPTMVSPAQMTHAGIILGTAAYMAPEQAKGRVVDKRADIWAFGCVLFEMLTGKPAFTGDSVTETLAAVMRDTPPLGALPAETPSHVRRLVARCLERDPKQRLRDIGEARMALDGSNTHDVVQAPSPTAGRRPLVVGAAAALVAAVVAGAVAWRLKPAAAVPLRKFDLALNTGMATLSPDGSRIAYAVADRLFLRDLTATEPRDLGALPREIDHVGWSPDGNTIFTAARDGKIRTIPARGGAHLIVCEIPESHETIGVTWIGSDLVFAVWRGSLYRVDARGGTPKLWLAVEGQKDVDFHGLASLPDGRVVFSAHEQNGEFTTESFDGVKRSELLPSIGRPSTDAFGTVGQFWYSATGHLLFTRFDANGGLWAVPFRGGTVDPKQAILVAPNVSSASVANDGTLLIRIGSETAMSFDLVTVNRSGHPGRTLIAATAGVSSPAVSPDGRQVAVIVNTGGQRQVWVQETAGTSGSRLTAKDDEYGHPAWFPNGERVLYTGPAPVFNAPEIWAAAKDGSGAPQKLGIGHRAEPTADGKEVVYAVDEGGRFHLRRGVPGAAANDVERVFKTDPEPSVRSFAVSPDGSLLAYVDYKAGRADLLVTRYPTAEGRWQVYGNGGRALWAVDDSLRWARGTHELFFTISRGEAEGASVMVADVRAEKTGVTVAQPTALFDIDADALAAGFDVSPDGKTFYFRRRAATSSKGPARRFVLIQNWAAEFGR